MMFLDREEEIRRLDRLARRSEGGLAVLHGRRRLGKTRLLLEWVGRHGGLYTVADRSAAEVQRRYFAETVATRLPGFGDVVYPDWAALFARLAREASAAGFRGPIVLDEIPYLVASAPELPSVLQRFVDHDARRGRLVIGIAGSSRAMMDGIALSAAAPLYGRAAEILAIGPLPARCLLRAFPRARGPAAVELQAAFGGVPRYWELAAGERGSLATRIDRLVLDPLGPLHDEPDRLLAEDQPPALSLRPILDAIGHGANRVSEIGGRVGMPATSLARPLERLVSMGLVRRDVPFGEPERSSRRSLYRIDDPFFRMWFRTVAPHRAQLAVADRRTRMALLKKAWPALIGAAWEELCRRAVPGLRLARLRWGPAGRYWRGEEPEWDIVGESLDGQRLLLGEARFGARPLPRGALEREAARLAARPPPAIPGHDRGRPVRVLFVPALAKPVARIGDVLIVTAADVIAAA